jgi:PleD family two-component response regulator
MGISTYTGGEVQPETMLRNADKAMYEAKGVFDIKFKFYQPVG